MKKLIVGLLFLASSSYAIDIREYSKESALGAVSVSTTTTTAIPTTALSGRYKVKIQNTDTVYSVYIGTHSGVTTATGWEIKVSTSTFSSVEIPVGSGVTLYGIGQANSGQSTVNVRIWEFR